MGPWAVGQLGLRNYSFVEISGYLRLWQGSVSTLKCFCCTGSTLENFNLALLPVRIQCKDCFCVETCQYELFSCSADPCLALSFRPGHIAHDNRVNCLVAHWNASFCCSGGSTLENFSPAFLPVGIKDAACVQTSQNALFCRSADPRLPVTPGNTTMSSEYWHLWKRRICC